MAEKDPDVIGPKLYEKLPDSLKTINSDKVFQRHLKELLSDNPLYKVSLSTATTAGAGVGGATPAASPWRRRPSARGCQHFSHLSRNVLRARRGVIRMLIVVVLTFAVCNLPYHARKMWQYWSTGYRGSSDFSSLLTPLTFLVTYFNSGINPLLYAFLSKNFRKGMRELLFCTCHANKRKADNLVLLNRGAGALRRSSTRSTRANCSTVTTAPNGDS